MSATLPTVGHPSFRQRPESPALAGGAGLAVRVAPARLEQASLAGEPTLGLFASWRVSATQAQVYRPLERAFLVVALDAWSGEARSADLSTPTSRQVRVDPTATGDPAASVLGCFDLALPELLGLAPRAQALTAFVWLDELISPPLALTLPGDPPEERPSCPPPEPPWAELSPAAEAARAPTLALLDDALVGVIACPPPAAGEPPPLLTLLALGRESRALVSWSMPLPFDQGSALAYRVPLALLRAAFGRPEPEARDPEVRCEDLLLTVCGPGGLAPVLTLMDE
ncbi:MAG: hypothetical protein AB7N76_28560 [Planctomycetota bacterium]